MKRSTALLSLVFCVQILFCQNDTSSFDPLLLREVVITELNSEEKLKTPISLSTIGRPADLQIQGAAALLNQIPGLYTDASVGESFSRVHSRGVSLSAEDDIGWYYMSLQEDGLPITLVQYNQFSPDFFIRPDLSHNRVEVIKGGKSNILAPSAPGGIVNFISNKLSESYETHDRITTGIYNSGRPYLRIEGFSGSQIGKSSWSYDFGYMWRTDKGPRKIDYTLNQGGLIKIGVKKSLPKGILSAKIKWLDDQVNRYTGVAAHNWENPTPSFGQSFQETSLLPPGFDGTIIDPRNNNQSLSYNPANGINTKELSAAINLDLQLGEWRLSNKFKYSSKNINWQTVIGGQPLRLDDFITYFISGDPFPIGNVRFTDVSTNQEVATVDNQGVFAVFQGLPPSFQYVNGQLPNDAILGSGTWFKDDHINDLMNQFLLSREFENLTLDLGLFNSHSTADIFTNASFLFATYEPEPKLLSVNLEGLDGSQRALSDENGLSNPGGLFYEAADMGVSQFGFFGNARFHLVNNLFLETGWRYEHIGHSGTRDRSGSNGGPIVKTGEDEIDASYNYLNYSVSIDYNIDSDIFLFSRFSLGHKTPELNYYINNFANQDIPSELPPVQNIQQFELGFKLKKQISSLAATLFRSGLTNVAYSNFVFDEMENQIFYTPTQFNSSNTYGLELEYSAALTQELSFNSSTTLQKSKLDEFTLYDANGTIDIGDDKVVDFSENQLPHSPSIMMSAGLTYNQDVWFAALRINYIGDRYGNLENSFNLPSYQTVDLDIGYSISNQFSIGLRAKNLFNSAGLANFFGPNQFGSNSDAASTEYISANPNADFVVFPIMPRVIYISLDYNFGS